MDDFKDYSIDIPTFFTQDMQRAIKILTDEGCNEIYLFGSLSTGSSNEKSDIDLGIKSYPKANFFKIYGKLLNSLDHPFDLVDFDLNEAMFDVLNSAGEVKRIA